MANLKDYNVTFYDKDGRPFTMDILKCRRPESALLFVLRFRSMANAFLSKYNKVPTNEQEASEFTEKVVSEI